MHLRAFRYANAGRRQDTRSERRSGKRLFSGLSANFLLSRGITRKFVVTQARGHGGNELGHGKTTCNLQHGARRAPRGERCPADSQRSGGNRLPYRHVVGERALNTLPLKFGVLQGDNFLIQRSGVTWLCDDGHECQPNEVIAYCYIGLEPKAGGRTTANPFGDEQELQVAFAPRVGGRLRKAVGTSRGGHLSVFGAQPWDPDAALGFLEVSDAERLHGDAVEAAGTLRLLMLAGRRVSSLASHEAGLLPGWYSRSRAWWFDQPGVLMSHVAPDLRCPTLLGLGICDSTGPLRGDRRAFNEMFATAPYPAQIVFVGDSPVTPCAPVLLEQFSRTPAQFRAIAADLQRALTEARTIPSADDWFFAGTMLTALERSPIRDCHTLLTASGLRQTAPPSAVLLSLNAEFSTILRHRELGYSLHVMRHFQAAAGPAMRAWLDAAFKPVTRTVADIKLDYIRLFDTTAAELGTRFLIINRMSTSGQEDITSYQAFDAPMSAMLETIAAKELNLMLYELAEERGISIIDIDSIAANLGGAVHLPDGVHQSGLMQAVIRDELFACLEAG